MRSLGRYELMEQLGTGSMGTVYLARDTILDRRVALKTIRTGATVDEEVRERFHREAKTCARLQHPSIVTVFDMGEQDKFAYIAMELLIGCDLKKHIEQRSPLPLPAKLEAMIQVCDALSHAHHEGIVHRDIKPSNLYLTTGNRAKVLDFGIARLPSSRLTVVGRVLGTPNYMAPEQILGSKSDGRADLFSAAVVFFEFLVYHHPFQSPLVPRRILDSEPDSIFDYDSSVPLPFEQIFAKALSKDPEQRYATGAELAADIRAVLEGVRLNASPTFSSVSLPSERAVPIEQQPETPIFNEEPGIDDPEEWRLSEFLRILPDFEEAVEQGAYKDAEAALAKLRSIEAVDSRFVESVRLCESRLAAIDAGSDEESGEPVASTEPVGDEFPHGDPASARAVALGDESLLTADVQPRCASCGAVNRGGAAFCLGCGARRTDTEKKPAPEIPFPSSDAASNEANEANDAEDKTRLYVPHMPAPKLEARPQAKEVSQRPPTIVRTETQSQWQALTLARLKGMGSTPAARIKIAIFAGSAIVLMLILILFLVLRSPTLEPFVATARVGAKPAALYDTGDASRAPVATAPVGALIHILAAPKSDADVWLKAQWIDSGKPKSPARYVRRDAVGEFDSQDAATLLSFARTAGPGESGTMPELLRQLAAYDDAERHFGNSAPQSVHAAASLEAANLELALAKKLKDDNRENWRDYAIKARDASSALPNEPGAARILERANQMLSPPLTESPSPPVETTSTRPEVTDLLDRANYLYSKGKYDQGIALCEQARHFDPTNKEIKRMIDKLTEGKRVEEGIDHDDKTPN